MVHPLEPYDLRPLRVLVVDDEPSMLEILKGILSRCGIAGVTTSSDAPSAFERMHHIRPDVIFVDWEMEPLDGNDFCRLVRSDANANGIEIGLIMITGFADERRVRQAIKAGVDDFIAKPISTEGVKTKLVRYIDRKRPDLQERCVNPLYQRLQQLEGTKAS